ncbi:hypothetical protein [Pseudomonas syringae group genomosp. 3]|uniref:hypothetical protein n=1 Tax=Pseudomonas syringae group genomosp. 3 TaxID=251701 RepID=UPI001E378C2E|nr:hypothetical protein [Pseudomonas syringae group genomosp. 3]
MKSEINGSLDKVSKSDINKHYDKIINYRDKVVRTRAIVAKFDARNKIIPEGLKDLDHDMFGQLSDLVGKVMPPSNYKWAALNKPISAPPAPVSAARASSDL